MTVWPSAATELVSALATSAINVFQSATVADTALTAGYHDPPAGKLYVPDPLRAKVAS
jgi:hypothetical protein